MTTATMAEPDTRGVRDLSGVIDDSVASLPTLIFDQLYEEMFDDLIVAEEPVDLGFDDDPWRQLPTIEDLQYLWLTCTPLAHLIAALAIKAHGDGPDLPMFIARQRERAELELAWTTERKAGDVGQPDDMAGPGTSTSLASAEAGGGGGNFPGGPQDGDAMGAGGEADQRQDGGQAQKISRKRGASKAGGGDVGDAADNPPAAA